MALSVAPEILVHDLIQANYVGGIPAGTSLRTSPALDNPLTKPYISVEVKADNSQNHNIGGTSFRVVVDVWIHVGAKEKATMQTLADGVLAVHRLVWKAPGSGAHWINHLGVANTDMLDRKPPIYQRTVKWQIIYYTA